MIWVLIALWIGCGILAYGIILGEFYAEFKALYSVSEYKREFPGLSIDYFHGQTHVLMTLLLGLFVFVFGPITLVATSTDCFSRWPQIKYPMKFWLNTQ